MGGERWRETPFRFFQRNKTLKGEPCECGAGHTALEEKKTKNTERGCNPGRGTLQKQGRAFEYFAKGVKCAFFSSKVL
jgi:hypothetical protein